MNILINTGHPAQIHNFKELKVELEDKGHKVFWMASDKEISKYLLVCYNINYTLLKRPGKGFVNKFLQLIKNSYQVWWFIRKNKIELAISRVSPYVSLGCFFSGCKHFAMTDTETAGFYDKFFGFFVTSLFTAKSFNRNLRKNQVRFNGNIELFYLHPNRFSPTPQSEVKKMLGIKENEEYIIMRFVSWDAYHDKGLTGFSDKNKVEAVRQYSQSAKVFISAESELPSELEPYRISIAPEHMHDVLAHATLFFGESATMASESAVLGTPAIYLDKVGRGYTDEEEKYGLVYNFKNDIVSQTMAIDQGLKLLNYPLIKEKTQEKRKKFLIDKIDPTAFLVWFIENYPASAKVIKENPDYQYNFK